MSRSMLRSLLGQPRGKCGRCGSIRSSPARAPRPTHQRPVPTCAGRSRRLSTRDTRARLSRAVSSQPPLFDDAVLEQPLFALEPRGRRALPSIPRISSLNDSCRGHSPVERLGWAILAWPSRTRPRRHSPPSRPLHRPSGLKTAGSGCSLARNWRALDAATGPGDHAPDRRTQAEGSAPAPQTSGSSVSSHSRQTQSSVHDSRALSAAGTIVTPQAGQIGGRSSSIARLSSNELPRD